MRKKIKLIGITAALICAGVSRVARIAEQSKEYIQTHYANPNLNGAMIAAQGYYQYMAGHTAGLDLNGLPTLPIDYE